MPSDFGVYIAKGHTSFDDLDQGKVRARTAGSHGTRVKRGPLDLKTVITGGASDM